METRLDKQQARNFIEETFEQSFDKTRFTAFIKNLLNRIEEAAFTYQGQFIPEAYRQYISTLERIGKFNDGENRIDILIIKLQRETSLERARTNQRNFVAGYLQGKYGSSNEKEAALVAFVSPDNADWRFSLVKMDYKFEQSPTGKIKVKEEFNPARRWSFLVGVNERSHTAQSRLVNILANDEHAPSLAELEESFNIETVTKEFFLKYRDLFIRTKEALDKVVKNDARIKADFEAKGINTVDFAKKLLGQIVFLYFLQKKGWFGAGRDADWGEGSKQFLRELFEGIHGSYNNFFNDILEPLFYEALRNDRSHDDDYYSRFNCKIPFLNGGLFDPIGNYDWVHTDIILPDNLFSNKKKTREGDIGDGILDIFDRYNFTVKEDEPLEKEVAIDPELLGKAYEKFNAIRPDNFEEYKKALKSGKKGDETKFNKQFGVYYTPREIVHYMCQQSLINHLATEMEGSVSKEDIETLIHLGEQVGENEEIALIKQQKILEGKQKSSDYTLKLPERIRKNGALVDQKLTAITVCDPAVGSGAFPVGMMSEIVRARNVLSTFIEDEDRKPYDFKRQCIEHSLYGVDIDPGAVEIAKLRLWLSLVVDEDAIKNIKPLPNLDYKIVCGNSLLGFPESWDSPLAKEIEAMKHAFFRETNPKKKSELRINIDEKINSRYTNSLKIFGYEVNFDFQTVFSEVFHEKGGFDVVIANPPYVRMEEIKKLKPMLKQQYGVFHPRADLYCYFLELSYKILKTKGFSTFINSNKYLRSGYGGPLRNLLKENTAVKQIVNFGGYKVFENATVDTAIIIFQKDGNDNIIHSVEIQEFQNGQNLSNYIRLNGLAFNQKNLSKLGWALVGERSWQLMQKIRKKGKLLRDCDIRIVMGIKSGLKSVFEIDEQEKNDFEINDPKVSQLIKPLIHGKEVKRWDIVKPERYILFIKRGTNIAEYKEIFKYLMAYKDDLSKRATVSTHPWYELQQPQMGIYEEFEKERIIYPDISSEPAFTICPAGVYCDNTTYNITTNSRFILAILNSKLIDYFYRNTANSLGKGAVRYFTQYIEQIPIPSVDELVQKTLVGLVNKILDLNKSEDYAENVKKQATIKEYEKQIDRMVYELYGLTEEEIKIVEGGDENAR